MPPTGFNLVDYLRQFTPTPKVVAENLRTHFGAFGAAYVVQQSAFRDEFDIAGMAEVLMQGEEFFEPEEIDALYQQFPLLRRLRGGRLDYGALAGMELGFEARTDDPEANVGFSFRQFDDVPSYEVLGAFDKQEWRHPFDYRTGATQPVSPGDIEQFRRQRFEDIRQSRTGRSFLRTPIDSDYRTASEVTLLLPEAGQALSSFAKKNAAGQTQAARSVTTGRFLKISDFLPTESENRALLEDLGVWLRGEFVKRYDELPLGKMGAASSGEGSGTLRRAVSEMTVEITRERGQEHRLRLTLPEMSRPSRHQGDPAVSVRYYGPRVFKGRVGLISRENFPMRFQVRGEWLTARNVRPSRKDLNVLEVTTDLRQRLTREYFRLLEARVKARDTGAASQRPTGAA